MKLSILIPTLPQRKEGLLVLMAGIGAQVYNYHNQVNVITNDRVDLSIGTKRNRLLEKSDSDYVCFIDDDDLITPKYIKLLMNAIESGCDCASLKGVYFVNDNFDGIFEHSLKYKEWKTTTNEVKYERYPNHLNMIRASIAKQFKFPETNHGEDHDWSKQIHESGLLKTEYYIPEILYYYLKVTK